MRLAAGARHRFHGSRAKLTRNQLAGPQAESPAIGGGFQAKQLDHRFRPWPDVNDRGHDRLRRRARREARRPVQ